MAHNWLGLGAVRFAVGDASGTLQEWRGGNLVPQGHNLRQPVTSSGSTAGFLEVEGITDRSLANRLAAEAQYTGKWLQLEQEIQSLTGELIYYQDQFLMLHKLSQLTRQQLQPGPVIRSYLATAQQLLGTRWAGLIEVGEAGVSLQASEPAVVGLPQEAIPLLQTLLRAGEPVLDNTLKGIPGWKSYLFVPLKGQLPHPHALLLVNRTGDRFDTPAIKLGETLVEFLGSELERLRLYQDSLQRARLQTEAEMAREVQMQLLPRQVPAVHGLEIFGRSLPARQVGGDFFDFFTLVDGGLFFTLGDVSGKGMPSALVMSNLRATLRSYLRLMPHENVQRLMKEVTRGMYEDLTEVEMIATLFAGRYEPAEKRIAYANAGHAPIIYCPAGGRARLLPASGPALGFLPDSVPAEQAIPFGEGDLLIVASDGLNETSGPAGELFGYDRLMGCVEENRQAPARTMAENLLAAVHGFQAGEEQEDDQTIIVIRGER